MSRPRKIARSQSEKLCTKEKLKDVFIKSKSCISTFLKKKSIEEEMMPIDIESQEQQALLVTETEEDFLNITIPHYTTPVAETGSQDHTPGSDETERPLVVSPVEETILKPVLPCVVKLSNIALFTSEEQRIEVHNAIFGRVIEDGIYVIKDKNLYNIISPRVLECLPQQTASATPILPHPPQYMAEMLRNEMGLQYTGDCPLMVHIQTYTRSQQYPILHLMGAQLFCPGQTTYVIPFDLNRCSKEPLLSHQGYNRDTITVKEHLMDQIATACSNTDQATRSVCSTFLDSISIDIQKRRPHIIMFYQGQEKILQPCFNDQELVHEVQEHSRRAIEKRIEEMHKYCAEERVPPRVAHVSSDNRHEVLGGVEDVEMMQWNWFEFFVYLKVCGIKYSPMYLSKSKFVELGSMFNLSLSESNIALKMFQQLQLLCYINDRYYISACNIAPSLLSLASKTSNGMLEEGALTTLEEDLFEHLLKQKLINKKQKLAPFSINFHTHSSSNPFGHARNNKIPPMYVLPSDGMTPPGFFESFVLAFASNQFGQLYSSRSFATFTFMADKDSSYFVQFRRKKQFIKVHFSCETNETISMEKAQDVSGIIWRHIELAMLELKKSGRVFLECADHRCKQKHKKVHLTEVNILKEEVMCCRENVRDKIEDKHKMWIAAIKKGSKTIKPNTKEFKSVSRPSSTTSAELESLQADNLEVLEYAEAEKIKTEEGSFDYLYSEFVKKHRGELNKWLDLKAIRQHFYQYELIDNDMVNSLRSMESSQRNHCITVILDIIRNAGPRGIVALVSVVRQTIENDHHDDHQNLHNCLSDDMFYRDILKLWLHSMQ